MKSKWILTLIMTVMIAATGCGKTEKKDDLTPTPDIGIGNEGIKEEPTLTKEAKKLDQFSDVKEGDITAEIVIKDYGSIFVKLFADTASKAVENFTVHAKEGYFDGLSFHRVIDDFMIQGGDPTGTGAGGESIWGENFEDEFSEQLQPYRGALCMANTGPNTNGSQFFLVQQDSDAIREMQALLQERYKMSLQEYISASYKTELTEKQINQFLTYGGAPWLSGHHTVFGQIYEGFDVLDTIAATSVDSKDVPLEPVIIQTVKISE